MKLLETIGEILESDELSGFRAGREYHLGGKYVRALEDAFCDYFGVKYAVSMNSATSCLHSAMIALGIRAGDSVITTPYTFSATAASIKMVNAVPVFCDIEDRTFNLDPDLVCTPHTDAILVVHLHGQAADMDGIMKYNTPVIEDCAQAIGAKYMGKYVGTIGDCGVFSFNQWKQVSTGEGGMLITNNPDIANTARLVRNHGENMSNLIGYNYRMLEITAAIALDRLGANFSKLEQNLERRNQVAERLSRGLLQIDGLTPPFIRPQCSHSFYTYAVKFDEKKIGMPRGEFQKRMSDRGIYFGGEYVKPLHLLPVFGAKEGQCPVAERMWRGELCVTDIIKHDLTLTNVASIIDTMKAVIDGN